MQEPMFEDIDFSSLIFKVNHVFIKEEDNPLTKNCYSLGKTR